MERKLLLKVIWTVAPLAVVAAPAAASASAPGSCIASNVLFCSLIFIVFVYVLVSSRQRTPQTVRGAMRRQNGRAAGGGVCAGVAGPLCSTRRTGFTLPSCKIRRRLASVLFPVRPELPVVGFVWSGSVMTRSAAPDALAGLVERLACKRWRICQRHRVGEISLVQCPAGGSVHHVHRFNRSARFRGAGSVR